MYYVKNRYYDPQIRRFISADEIGVVTTSLKSFAYRNLYAYCDENPLARLDADGDFWIHVVAGIINVASSGIAAAVTGQSYGGKDMLASFAAGFFGVSFPNVSGLISGAYTIYSLLNDKDKDVSLGAAIGAGIVSGILTGATFGNLAGRTVSIELNKALTTGVDAVFGVANNSMSAATAVSVKTSSPNKKKNPATTGWGQRPAGQGRRRVAGRAVYIDPKTGRRIPYIIYEALS